LATHQTQILAFVISLAALLVTRHILIRIVERRAGRRHRFSGVFLNSVRLPSYFWCLAGALAIAIRIGSASANAVEWANKGIGAFLIISISLVIAAVLVRMVTVYGEREKMPFAVAGLSRTLIYIVVLTIAAMILLHQFRITITPILTALGVGGLAVALALQDTLANFFAGVHILVEEPVMVGDFIKLSTGEEGVVKDIGWRTTRIHTHGNNMIVVPNTKITSSTLTNYSMPEKRVVADIIIVASHEADPNQIAEIAMEVAETTEGVLTEPPPTVLFDPGITPTHTQMKLLVHVATQLERGQVASSIRVRLFERFRHAGIPLPQPERMLRA
jgi:small-conductance mechanosensitive channel